MAAILFATVGSPVVRAAFFILATTFAGLLHAADTTAEKPVQTLRVMSYNIHHGRGTDGQVDLARLAKVIRNAKPDLVALQEVDNGCRRSGVVDQTAELARLTGLNGKFAKHIPYQGGDYGQAILSRFPLSDVVIHWLPGDTDRDRRVAGAATIEVPGQSVVFVTTHLHHQSDKAREQQASELNRVFSQNELPVLLAGDLNANPDSSVMDIFRKDWLVPIDAQIQTFPAQGPTKQIDYVVARPKSHWICIGQSVPEQSQASDHLPLVVEWTLKK